MKSIDLFSEDPGRTEAIGKWMASHLSTATKIGLRGDIGAGKTVFAKGFFKAFEIDPAQVQSPTYSLMNKYPGNGYTLCHLDCYRLNNPEELIDLDPFSDDGPSTLYLIEWYDRFDNLLKKILDFTVSIDILDRDKRKITIVQEQGLPKGWIVPKEWQSGRSKKESG